MKETLVIACFDIETANDPEQVGWVAEDCDLAVGLCRWYGLSEERTADGRPTGRRSLWPLAEGIWFSAWTMLQDLAASPADVFCAFNGAAFDLPLLGGASVYAGEHAVRRAALARVGGALFDPMAELARVCQHPHPIALGDFAEDYQLRRVPVDHDEIPTLWATGERWKVIMACRDDVQILSRLLQVGASGRTMGLNRLRETHQGQAYGCAGAYRSPAARNPATPDETDEGGLYRYQVPTDWWPALQLRAANRDGERARPSTAQWWWASEAAADRG